MRKRIMIGVVAVICGAGIACTGPGMEAMGDAMVFAGDAMRDLGSADVGDASADTLEMTVDCAPQTGLTEYIAPDGSGTRTTSTYWFATLRDASIDPTTVSHATAIVCGLTTESVTTPAPACPDGYTCTSTAPAYPSLDCVSSDLQLERGVATVFCGNETTTESLAVGGTVRSSARTLSRRSTARFVIEQR